MSWMLKHRIKDNKWRIWTTISDGYVSDWLTEEEIKSILATQYSQDYRLKVIESYWTFPHGWYDKDTYKSFDNRKALIAYNEWHLAAIKSEDYAAVVNRKYHELVGREPDRPTLHTAETETTG